MDLVCRMNRKLCDTKKVVPMTVFQGQFRIHKMIMAENAYYPNLSLLGNNLTASRVGVACLMLVRN